MLTPTDTTSIAAEQGSAPTVEQFADWMAAGYADRLGVTPTARTLDEYERARIAEIASGFDDATWRAARRPRDDLDRRASAATMLGVLDVHLATDAATRIRESSISGDLIASDDTIPALERSLRGCPPERAAVGAAIQGALAEPHRFLLGIGPIDALVDTVMRALG